MRARWWRGVDWLRAHPTGADAVLAAALVVVEVAAFATAAAGVGAGEAGRTDAFGAVLAAGTAAPLAWRRRRPALVLAVTSACLFTFYVADYPGGPGGFGLLVAAYTVATRNPRRRAAVVLVAFGVALGALLGIGMARHEPRLSVGTILSNYAVFGTAWVFGDNVRRRRERMAALEERAAALERERQLLARQAVADERARIARELHDVVAHAVSVVVVQAAGARRVLDSDPTRAGEALGMIEQTGRDALVELRRLVSVLRDETGARSPDLGPQPGLAGLAELVERFRRAGLDVDLDAGAALVGPGGDGRGGISAAVELSAYRIVQEALTNVVKHAGPCRATVRVTRSTDDLEVLVLDDGRGAAVPVAMGSSGLGHVGMRERVALFGGSLRTGPRAGGGWRVQATLPLRAS